MEPETQSEFLIIGEAARALSVSVRDPEILSHCGCAKCQCVFTRSNFTFESAVNLR